ncbi:MAG: biopolymer transporter ExbD [Phycisphaerae bacterium]|nr:biopolymer transporter ExbD [Phycisphaerae bacterium]
MKRPPAATRLSLNLAPMVDVMMCMLIFFMLATKMVERENSHIDLPVAKAAKDAQKQALGNRFVVNIRDAALHGGEGAVYLVREETVPLVEVLERLTLESELDPAVNCVIRADRHLPYRYIEAVMVGCSRAKIRNITFGAVRTEGRAG